MRAFTLVEVITTVAIFSVIMIAVSAFEYNVLDYNRSGSTSLTNLEEIQSLLKTMTRELRSMEPGDDGAYPIIAAATSSVTFFANVDGDTSKEKVRYYIGTTTTTRTTVFRGVIDPSGVPATYNPSSERIKTLVTGVRNATNTPMFTYYDGMYAGTSSPMTYPLTLTSIRMVGVTMTVDTDPLRSPVTKTFTSQASLRNLKDNL